MEDLDEVDGLVISRNDGTNNLGASEGFNIASSADTFQVSFSSEDPQLTFVVNVTKIVVDSTSTVSSITLSRINGVDASSVISSTGDNQFLLPEDIGTDLRSFNTQFDASSYEDQFTVKIYGCVETGILPNSYSLQFISLACKFLRSIMLCYFYCMKINTFI